MSDTTIRVSEDVRDRLELLKRRGESYDDVLLRLTERDQWAGFGALADTDTDTREGTARVRAGMRAGTGEDGPGGA